MDAVSFFCGDMPIEWLKFVIRGHQQKSRSLSTNLIESNTWLSDDGVPHNHKIHSNNNKEWWNKQIGFLSTTASFEWHQHFHCYSLCLLIISAVWMRTINYGIYDFDSTQQHTDPIVCHGWKCVNIGKWTRCVSNHRVLNTWRSIAELIRWHTKDVERMGRFQRLRFIVEMKNSSFIYRRVADKGAEKKYATLYRDSVVETTWSGRSARRGVKQMFDSNGTKRITKKGKERWNSEYVVFFALISPCALLNGRTRDKCLFSHSMMMGSIITTTDNPDVAGTSTEFRSMNVSSKMMFHSFCFAFDFPPERLLLIYWYKWMRTLVFAIARFDEFVVIFLRFQRLQLYVNYYFIHSGGSLGRWRWRVGWVGGVGWDR